MSKGGYLLPWTNVYEKYTKFTDPLNKNHPLHTYLTKEFKDGNENLKGHLGRLEKYYADIRLFLDLADVAKRNPNSMIDGSTTARQALKAKEDELCNFKDTLEPYFYSYRFGLNNLVSISEMIAGYIQFAKQAGSFPGGKPEADLLKELLNAVRSISLKVFQDWKDEVKSPNGSYDYSSFSTYVKDRRITLLALEGMPPLPPTPGTTGTGATG